MAVIGSGNKDLLIGVADDNLANAFNILSFLIQDEIIL